MLKIENLTKKYGSHFAVDHLSLNIRPGEIYGFIGHNGAGKTTTLKSAAGILNFDEGEIYVNDISIKDQPVAVKKMMAYIPDNPDLSDRRRCKERFWYRWPRRWHQNCRCMR